MGFFGAESWEFVKTTLAAHSTCVTMCVMPITTTLFACKVLFHHTQRKNFL